ncbi:MAG TPA: TA system VapC family ribonuclease toxin [Candidatus Limnocylindrales bacterium]|nr:TA system VapC family ribonuclease toxin [Candidatus Limnocylindrales bacterium]
MLIDANLLLYSVDSASPAHDAAARWLEAQLNGERRIGLPWESLVGFTRVITNPRAVERPLPAETAWGFVDDWLAAPTAWIPLPTERHHEVLGGLIRRYRLAGRLIPDGHLAALAIEHGLEVASADSDFARFTEIRWVNPLR